MTGLEATLLGHIQDPSLAYTSVGPDVDGFYFIKVTCGDHEGQGRSRSPVSGLAYALEALADDLLGKS